MRKPATTWSTLPAVLSSEDRGQGCPQPVPTLPSPAPLPGPFLFSPLPGQGQGPAPLFLCRMAKQTAPSGLRGASLPAAGRRGSRWAGRPLSRGTRASWRWSAWRVSVGPVGANPLLALSPQEASHAHALASRSLVCPVTQPLQTYLSRTGQRPSAEGGPRGPHPRLPRWGQNRRSLQGSNFKEK